MKITHTSLAHFQENGIAGFFPVTMGQHQVDVSVNSLKSLVDAVERRIQSTEPSHDVETTIISAIAASINALSEQNKESYESKGRNHSYHYADFTACLMFLQRDWVYSPEFIETMKSSPKTLNMLPAALNL